MQKSMIQYCPVFLLNAFKNTVKYTEAQRLPPLKNNNLQKCKLLTLTVPIPDENRKLEKVFLFTLLSGTLKGLNFYF